MIKEENNEDPRSIDIVESKGHREVVGKKPKILDIVKLTKTKKVNIRSEEEPKFAMIGDYWDEEKVIKITELLQKYQDIFPTIFFELKGTVGNLGLMRIPLKPKVKLVKKRTYRLNMKYK